LPDDTLIERMSVVKRTALLFMYLCIASFFAFSQEIADKDIPPDMNAILKRKELIVAMTASDQPPFFFVNKKGELEGFDVDIAKGMAKELNVGLTFNREAKSFNDVVALVASGKADVAVSKLSRTLARGRYVRFSKPYIVLSQGLLINRVQLARRSSEESAKAFIRDFDGKIGVIQKSSYVNYAKENFPKAQIVEYPSWGEAIAAVTSGDVLAVYRDELEIRKVFESLPNSAIALKPMYFTDLTDPIAVAVGYRNTQLLAWVDSFLEMKSYNVNSKDLISKYRNE
jgi:polar amino acid transport system substrate-binding protein